MIHWTKSLTKIQQNDTFPNHDYRSSALRDMLFDNAYRS